VSCSGWLPARCCGFALAVPVIGFRRVALVGEVLAPKFTEGAAQPAVRRRRGYRNLEALENLTGSAFCPQRLEVVVIFCRGTFTLATLSDSTASWRGMRRVRTALASETFAGLPGCYARLISFFSALNCFWRRWRDCFGAAQVLKFFRVTSAAGARNRVSWPVSSCMQKQPKRFDSNRPIEVREANEARIRRVWTLGERRPRRGVGASGFHKPAGSGKHGRCNSDPQTAVSWSDSLRHPRGPSGPGPTAVLRGCAGSGIYGASTWWTPRMSGVLLELSITSQ